MMEGCSSASKIDASLLEQFCSVTGASQDAGQHLLEACNGDLEMAIGMHMDGAGQTGTAAPPDTSQDVPHSLDGATGTVADEVRAPIPQKREVLVDQFSYAPTTRRRGAQSVFDGFRDFQAETRQAEERARRGEAVTARPTHKRRTLEDLFRPPIDLIYKGSFHTAKEAGTAANKWLLVNIQNVQEFSCQVLNRDVWSNPTIRNIVKKHFIFWQVYSDSEDGKRYMQFYNIFKWPYMSIVDPQTGEKFLEWNDIDSKTVLELVNTFLADRPRPDNSTESPPTKKARKEDNIVDASEDSQMEAAIQASLVQSRTTSTITVSSDDSDQSDASDSEDEEEESDQLETFSGSESETEPAQIPAKTTKYKSKTIQEVQIDSESDSNSQLEAGLYNSTFKGSIKKNKGKSKGKASANSRVSIKNGRKAADTVDLLDSSETSRSPRTMTDESRDGTATSESTSASSKDDPQSSSGGTTSNWKDYLGSEEDASTKLVIRYPDGRREPFTVPCSSKLRAIILYISMSDFDLARHELVTNFPRRNLSSMDPDKTLTESGLHPQETIFVQEIS